MDAPVHLFSQHILIEECGMMGKQADIDYKPITGK